MNSEIVSQNARRRQQKGSQPDTQPDTGPYTRAYTTEGTAHPHKKGMHISKDKSRNKLRFYTTPTRKPAACEAANPSRHTSPSISAWMRSFLRTVADSFSEATNSLLSFGDESLASPLFPFPFLSAPSSPANSVGRLEEEEQEEASTFVVDSSPSPSPFSITYAPTSLPASSRDLNAAFVALTRAWHVVKRSEAAASSHSIGTPLPWSSRNGDDDDDDDDGEDVLVWEEWTSGLVQARGREEAASRELLLVEVRRLVGVLGAGEGRMDLDGGNGGSGGGQGSSSSSSSSSSKMMTRSDMAASKASWESTLWDDSLDSATRRTLKERVLWCGDWLCRVDEEAKVVEITSGGNGGEWGDDDDREWYQALSFVAWQAAAPVASRSDFEQALVTTSTLRRLDQAKRRLETRRGDLAGMLRVLNKDVPPTETPREADTNAEKLPLQ